MYVCTYVQTQNIDMQRGNWNLMQIYSVLEIGNWNRIGSISNPIMFIYLRQRRLPNQPTKPIDVKMCLAVAAVRYIGSMYVILKFFTYISAGLSSSLTLSQIPFFNL